MGKRKRVILLEISKINLLRMKLPTICKTLTSQGCKCVLMNMDTSTVMAQNDY